MMNERSYLSVKASAGVTTIALADALLTAGPSTVVHLVTHDLGETCTAGGIPTPADPCEVALGPPNLFIVASQVPRPIEHIPAPDVVIHDLGMIRPGDAAPGSRFLVIRPCYLALRRALSTKPAVDGIVLVEEPERSLNRRDVEAVLDRPVVATVPYDPAVARSVDSGLLSSRVPKSLAQALRSMQRVPA